MLILLARISSGTTCVTGAHVQNQVRVEHMRPAAAVISALAAAAGRALLSYRIKDCDVLLGEAKEDVVAITKTVIDSELPTIGLVGGRATLGEIVLRVSAEVRPACVRLEELLHRRKNQRLRNLETYRADRLILLLGRIYRQRITSRVTAKLIAEKIGADLAR